MKPLVRYLPWLVAACLLQACAADPTTTATTQAGAGGQAAGGAGSGGSGGSGGVALGAMRIGTWNLHNFSKYGTDEFRIDDIAAKLIELDLDMVGVQELKVADNTDGSPPQAWDSLLTKLPAYDGIHNPWDTFDSTVGMLYKSERVDVLNHRELFENDSYAFPRPPLEVEVAFRADPSDAEARFHVVVLHLKAFGDSVDRRRAACAKLDQYMQDLPDAAYLVIGDLNDDPYDPPQENSFTDTFLDNEPTYQFLTASLPPESVTSLGWYHEVNGVQIDGEFLDHAIVTQSLASRYSQLTPVIVSVPNSEFNAYESKYSDHFPVIIEFSP